jgi:hypothetical protein
MLNAKEKKKNTKITKRNKRKPTSRPYSDKQEKENS